MRSLFDNELAMLGDMLTRMGKMIEKSITQATQAVVSRDAKKAKKAISAERDIDRLEREIEALCLQLLLKQQPVARDLRFISAALKMITDMERIGDQAADISELARFLKGKKHPVKLDYISQMAELTIKMVAESVDSFVNKDLELAQKVIDDDDAVDALFIKAKDYVIEMIRKDSRSGEQAIDLMMVAKYYERIGDHATNIAEWVVFAITGKHRESE